MRDTAGGRNGILIEYMGKRKWLSINRKERMWECSPVSSSLCRGDTGVCGLSSAPNNSCRRCGRTASSQARKTTYVTKETSLLLKHLKAIHFHTRPMRLLEGFYLMQREHSKSVGSSGSLGKLLQVFSLEGFFLELSANPANHQMNTHTKC